MDPQPLLPRLRQGLRQGLQGLRRALTFRRILRVTLVVTGLGFLAITTEAVIRAKIGLLSRRVPTALYTRPSPRGGGDRQQPAIPIGVVNGAALERRIPVAMAEFPDHLVQAVIAAEDQRFYSHHGLDIKRIGGAFLANLKAGGITQGGSTITQQLAKNLFLNTSRNPLRKLREAAMAVVLELRYDKRVILEAYLNEIYLGQDADRALKGVGAAARYYFGKDVTSRSGFGRRRDPGSPPTTTASSTARSPSARRWSSRSTSPSRGSASRWGPIASSRRPGGSA